MGKNWVSSPLGIKILLDLYGKGLKKDFNAYSNINKVLNSKEHFTINNNLFLLSSIEKCMMLERKKIYVQTATFESHQEFIIGVKNWVLHYGRFKQFTPEKYINATGLLTNVCMYKGIWRNKKNNLVTIYNSFSYTEDVKYEARILVVPTNDKDLLLAIVVPNESDVFRHVATELNERGLAAALNSIQPAFAATCKQPLPMFKFETALELRNSTDRMTATQYGEIKTDDSGIEVKVLTCIPVKKGEDEKLSVDYRTPSISSKCFSFAIVYKDLPLFTGQVLP